MFCLTESMINRLSKVHNLFVIARNSTFTYKDRSVRVQQVAEELGSTGRQRLELR
jgi:adenylate cyclase